MLKPGILTTQSIKEADFPKSTRSCTTWRIGARRALCCAYICSRVVSYKNVIVANSPHLSHLIVANRLNWSTLARRAYVFSFDHLPILQRALERSRYNSYEAEATACGCFTLSIDKNTQVRVVFIDKSCCISSADSSAATDKYGVFIDAVPDALRNTPDVSDPIVAPAGSRVTVSSVYDA